MNTTAIIAAIVALIGGWAAGTTITNNDTNARVEAARTQTLAEAPQAADYVSLRPEVATLPNETLSEEEIAGLLFMREEEKLARDVYQTLYETWHIRTFANIAQSEQTHTEAVRDLLEKYNLDDPVTDDTIGVFTNETLANLYIGLVTKGKQSEVDALIVGATIEDLDIKDLQEQLALTDNADITLVYENLTRGSRNHLRSFTKQLTMRGETYTPQYISATEYESIVDSATETGMGSGTMQNNQSGRGWGMGRNR